MNKCISRLKISFLTGRTLFFICFTGNYPFPRTFECMGTNVIFHCQSPLPNIFDESIAKNNPGEMRL